MGIVAGRPVASDRYNEEDLLNNKNGGSGKMVVKVK